MSESRTFSLGDTLRRESLIGFLPSRLDREGAASRAKSAFVGEVSLADLGVTIDRSIQAPQVGDTITYIITVSNNGPAPASNVAVQDVLSPNLTFVSADLGSGSYDQATGLWTISLIFPGTPASLLIQATVDAAGPINNSATIVGASPGDPNPSNDFASDTVTAVCFLTGTLIRTARGEVPVEHLAIGDTVLTADGDTRPVTWIGRQSVVAAFADPVRSYPIRIQAGALSEGVPARDLFLSPDHALLIDGVLVQAGALVNGATVTRVMNPEAHFSYYHVETEDHAIILAEGTPAETFVSNVTRRTFDNYAEYEALFGARADFEAMADRDEPRAMSARQVPAGIKARLSARAASLMPVEAAAT